MLKRKLALLGTAMVLATGMFAGCNGKTNTDTTNPGTASEDTSKGDTTATENTGTKPSGDMVNLKALLVGTPPSDEKAVLEAVNQKLAADGMNMIIETTYTEDYWNKLALSVAGGEVFDVAWAHASTLSDLVGKGAYQPIDSVFEEAAPHIKASTPAHVLQSGKVNDELYALARVIPMAEYNLVYNIRGDLREKYGMPKITTLEQLETYFDNVLAQETDMIPTADHNMQPLYPVFANYYFPIGDGGGNPVYVDPTDDTHTVKSFFESEGFKKAADTKFKWREKGYIAADETKLAGDAGGGFNYGIVACVPSNTLSETERVDALVENVPGAFIETVLLNPDPLYLYQGGDNMLAVPSTSKNVKEAVAFIDWIKTSQDNFDLWSFGVKDVNYKLDGDSISYDGIETDKQYRPNVWMWNDMSLARFSKNVPEANIEGLKNWDEKAISTPFIGFNLNIEPIKAETAQVSALIEEYYLMLKEGTVEYDAVIGEFSDKLKSAGIDKVIEETQTQLNAFLGK